MRTASLNIKKMTQGKSSFWVINVPSYLNPSSKNGKMHFHTKAEAERKRGELLAAVRTDSKVTVLSNAQKLDAARALGRLAECGIAMPLSKTALPYLQVNPKLCGM